jgi:hypothetical protein
MMTWPLELTNLEAVELACPSGKKQHVAKFRLQLNCFNELPPTFSHEY